MSTRPFFRDTAPDSGLTLVEVLVTISILLAVMASVLAMLLTAKNIWLASVNRVSVSQDLQIAASKIATELRGSDASLITDNTEGTPASFCFLSARDRNGSFVTDESGAPVWQKCVIYYIPPGTGRLLRKEVYETRDAPLTPAQMAAYLDGEGTQYAAALTGLRLTPSLADNSAVLSMTGQRTGAHGREDRQSLTIIISMRN
jgi:hypothetical protein